MRINARHQGQIRAMDDDPQGREAADPPSRAPRDDWAVRRSRLGAYFGLNESPEGDPPAERRSWSQIVLHVVVSAVIAGALFGTLGMLLDGDSPTLNEIVKRGGLFAALMGLFYFVMAARAKRDAE